MSCGYEWLYKLPVGKLTEPHWYKLLWRPIKNGTWNLYTSIIDKSYSVHLFGIRFGDASAHNGWGRSWDGFWIELGFYYFIINFWIRWNIHCIDEGPSDVNEKDKRPLNITKGGRHVSAE